jgi:hypothetical protein
MEGQTTLKHNMEESLGRGVTSNPPTDEQLAQLNRPTPAFLWIWYSFNKAYLTGCIAIIPIGILFAGFSLPFRGNRLDWDRNKEGRRQISLREGRDE